MVTLDTLEVMDRKTILDSGSTSNNVTTTIPSPVRHCAAICVAVLALLPELVVGVFVFVFVLRRSKVRSVERYSGAVRVGAGSARLKKIVSISPPCQWNISDVI